MLDMLSFFYNLWYVQFFHQTQLDTARFSLLALSISLSLPFFQVRSSLPYFLK